MTSKGGWAGRLVPLSAVIGPAVEPGQSATALAVADEMPSIEAVARVEAILAEGPSSGGHARAKLSAAIAAMEAVPRWSAPPLLRVMTAAPEPVRTRPPMTHLELNAERRPRRPKASGWKIIRRLASLASLLVAAVVVAAQLGVGPLRIEFIATGSMAPTLPVGTLIVSRAEARSAVRVGQIVTAPSPLHPGATVTHRVIAIQHTPAGDQLVTKGDANSSPDSWRIPVTRQVWHSVVAMPQAAALMRFVHTRWGHWLAQIVPGLGLLTGLLSWIWRPSRSRSLAPAHA